MSFNDEVLKPGRGRAILVEGSIDGFATISYRWGDVAGALGGPGTMYQARVLSVAPVRRSLGQNRMASASTTEVILDNTDGALDALTGSASLDTQSKLRFRIWLDIYDPQNLPADISANARQLGEFSLSTWIRQDDSRLILTLADDVMNAVSQQASLPTLTDWQAVGTTANNPIKTSMGIPDSITEFSPIQLAFGEDWVLAMPHIIPYLSPDANYIGFTVIPVCVTSDTGAGGTYEISDLRVQYFFRHNVVRMADIPRTYRRYPAGVPTDITIWRTERSPTITKNGHTFKVIYLVVENQGFYDTMQAIEPYGFPSPDDRSPTIVADLTADLGSHSYDGGYSPSAIDWAGGAFKAWIQRIISWYVQGFPLSARTQTASPVQHPVDVLTDLVTYYSNNTSITVDATVAARVKQATQTAAVAGVVQGWTQGPKKGDPVFQQPPSLRQTITAICQSSDFDAFIDWTGKFSFACDFWDFRVATSGTATWTPDGGMQTSGNGTTTNYLPTVIPETWIDSLERWLPADGERWAPFNRLWLTGGKAYPPQGSDVPYQGPFDFDTAQPGAVPLASRIIEVTLQQGWRPYRQQSAHGHPAYWRSLSIVARDMVRFRTHIGGLQLELGQYFALSWTRGPVLGSPYSGTIFQCEGITYDPNTDSVEVTAVWRDDITTEQQYLLDDETLLVRSKLGGASTAGCFIGNSTISFTGTVNLTTMGVAIGDILVVRDSTAIYADDFGLSLAMRITSIVSATSVIVANAPQGNNAAVLNADWSILRGATTYPTAVSDPTNYPLGGDMYGKTTNAGVYSNASAGNRLISG